MSRAPAVVLWGGRPDVDLQAGSPTDPPARSSARPRRRARALGPRRPPRRERRLPTHVYGIPVRDDTALSPGELRIERPRPELK